METLLDHVFITVKDLARSIAFYETALKPLGIAHAIDYDGKDGPEGHPDLKGFGRDGRVFFWLRRARPTTASPARACITIPVITLRTFSIPTVTVSRRSTRAGNTANHRASKFQRAPTCG